MGLSRDRDAGATTNAADGGAPFEAFAGVALLAASMTAFGMAPLFFGALAEEKRLALSQVGLAVPIQAIIMGGVNLGADAFLKRNRQRALTAVCAIMFALLQLLYLRQSGTGALVLCALSSVPQGLILWVAMGAIARSAVPAQYMAYSEIALTLLKLVVSSLLAALLIPRWGINAGFVAAAAIMSIAFFAAFALDNDGSVTQTKERQPSGPLAIAGWIALIVVLMVWSGTMALLSYLLPLASAAGLPRQAANGAFVALLIGQILGGVIAASLSKRLPYPAALAIGAVIALCTLFGFHLSATAWQFWSAAAAFGFAFALAAPFIMPFLIAIDPTRRAAGKFMGAGLVGSALGPLLVSRFVGSAGAQSALYLAGAAFAVAFVIVTALRLSRQFRPALTTITNQPAIGNHL